MRRDDAGGTVLDLRVDVEDVDLALGPPLLLVEVSHHLLDLGQSSLLHGMSSEVLGQDHLVGYWVPVLLAL